MTTQVSLPQTAGDVEQQKKTEPRASATAASPPHLAGMLWFGGWLFTIGFAKLVWWKAILALIVWPYLLALAIR